MLFRSFPWHQDHESYYIYESAYNVLIVWIPLIKPNSNSTGLSVIPFDRLEKTKSLELFKYKGAQRILDHTGEFKLYDDETGEVYEIDFNPNDLAVNVESNIGDAVILRGDCLHKTQDNIDERLAVSIRCYQSEGVVKRDIFYSGCEHKHQMIDNSQMYKNIKAKYQEKEILTIRELLS